MIRCFVGEDTVRARKDARSLFERLREEDPSAGAAYFDDLLFDPALAADALTAENLFGGKNILYFDGILEHPEGESFYRSVLRETTHEVIVREEEPTSDLLAFFERTGTVEHYPIAKQAERREDSFAVAAALGARDKKRSWVEFEKARKKGLAMEEIHGTIFWAYKTMLLTLLLDKSAAAKAGVKDHSYRTYHSYAKNYSVQEIKDKISVLKDIYHRGHRGEGDLEDSLENFILEN
jgi:DNA polymerase III delta subunit